MEPVVVDGSNLATEGRTLPSTAGSTTQCAWPSSTLHERHRRRRFDVPNRIDASGTEALEETLGEQV